MSTIDVSIITPNLNGAQYLRECLESVAMQNGVRFEHWVMDGGSNDSSEAIVREFPHVLWHQGPDKGMSDAINHGFERAKGEWLIWLNADDRLKPDALRRLVELGRSGAPPADVVYGDFEFIDAQGRLIRRLRLPPWSPFISIHHCCYVPSTATLLRKSSVWDAGFRLREDFHYVMDGELYARLGAAGKTFRHLAAPLADFRLHGDNASMRFLGKSRDMDKILQAERQHIESRAIRRAYGITLFQEAYLNGLADGVLWILAKAWKGVRKFVS